MKTPIRFLSFFLVLFICGNVAKSQNDRSTGNTAPKTIRGSFIIHGKLTSEESTFYTRSIEAADFEQYRLQDAPVELEFKNGFKLELLSAKDLILKNKNQSINPYSYSVKKALPSNTYPVFEILKSGWITAEVKTTNSK